MRSKRASWKVDLEELEPLAGEGGRRPLGVPAPAVPWPVTARTYTAVVLAGDRIGDKLTHQALAKRKALLPVAGVPLLVRVLAEILRSPYVGRVVVLANDMKAIEDAPEIRHFLATEDLLRRISFHPGGRSPVTSLLKLRRDLGLQGALLLLTADMPFLSAAAIDDFAVRAAEGGEVAVGIIEKGVVERYFPGMRRTFIPLGGNGYKACNMFALRSERGWDVVARWEVMEEKRKSPLGLLAQLGLWNVVEAIAGRLSLDGAFERLSRILNCEVRPVLMSDPLLSVDVDRPRHLALANGIFARRRAAEDALSPRPLAIFDLDRTITTIGTFTPFTLYAAARLAPWRLLALPAVAALLIATKFGRISRKQLKTAMLRLLIGRVGRTRVETVIEDFTRLFLRRFTRPGALQVMDRERHAGALLVLATASYDFYAESFARALSFDGCISTRSLWDQENLTPGIDGDNCYGAEKLQRVQQSLVEAELIGGQSRPHITFYSDDRSDLPCLLWADEGVVVNPKRTFAKNAEARGLQIVYW